MYLFCGEPPKIFLMIRLQTTVPFPPLPELDMGVGEDSNHLLGITRRYLLRTSTCHSRPSTDDISSFPSLEISRRMYTVHLGKVFLARSTISSNKLPAYLQLYFQSYESLNGAVISQMATPLSMHIDFCQHEGIKDRLSCTLLSNATFCEAQPDRE